MVFEQRFAVVRLQPIGPSDGLHLDEPEIDAELDLLLAVAAQNLAHLDHAGFMRPIAKQVV